MYTNNGEGSGEIFRSKTGGTNDIQVYCSSNQIMDSVFMQRDLTDGGTAMTTMDFSSSY
jgi:hypothetical protein